MNVQDQTRALLRTDFDATLRALADHIAQTYTGPEDTRVPTAHAIARHLGLEGWPSAWEEPSESDKDIAVAQAVEFAEYVERQAKGTMRDAAKRFLSLPYSQEIARRLAPKGGEDA